jgi:hypothetical protein
MRCEWLKMWLSYDATNASPQLCPDQASPSSKTLAFRRKRRALYEQNNRHGEPQGLSQSRILSFPLSHIVSLTPPHARPGIVSVLRCILRTTRCVQLRHHPAEAPQESSAKGALLGILAFQACQHLAFSTHLVPPPWPDSSRKHRS